MGSLIPSSCLERVCWRGMLAGYALAGGVRTATPAELWHANHGHQLLEVAAVVAVVGGCTTYSNVAAVVLVGGAGSGAGGVSAL